MTNLDKVREALKRTKETAWGHAEAAWELARQASVEGDTATDRQAIALYNAWSAAHSDIRQALSALSAHEEEVRELLNAAKQVDVTGGGYVALRDAIKKFEGA